MDSENEVLVARQWFIFGGQLSCLKLSFAIPKISLLRFPYLLIVLLVMLAVELVCLLMISEKSDSGGVGVTLMVVFLCSYNFVAIVNSRTFENADRRLYAMIVNERLRTKDLQDQIERTNKLGRTVLAMAEVDEGDDDYDSETSSKTGSSGSGSALNGNLVSEFTFFSSLSEKVEKEGKAIPSADDLFSKVPDMRSFKTAMKMESVKRGFRYFCNQESNIENLIFYEQVDLFKRELKHKAKKLCYTFITPKAPGSVNINDSDRTECMEAVMGSLGHEVIHSSTFDKAQAEIMNVMDKDSLPRFRKSPLGRALMYSQIDEEWKKLVQDGLALEKK